MRISSENMRIKTHVITCTSSNGEIQTFTRYYVEDRYLDLDYRRIAQRVSRLYSTKQSCVRFIDRIKRGDTSIMDKYLLQELY